MKTVTAYTHLIKHFSEHIKLKNEVEVKILILRILIKIAHNFEGIFNVIYSEMSFIKHALYLYLIIILKLNLS